MADLVTRIIAEDKQFNDKIERSKKTVKGFSDEAGKAGQSAGGFDRKLTSLAGGALTKLIGGFGAAATAGAAFKKIIDSSQTSADNFQYILGGAKTTVDQFFKSISTGDFTNFVNGLGDVYKRAKQAEMALDQLWNTQLAFNLMGSEAQFKLTSARADANDRDLSPEVRRKALADWKDAIEEMRGYSETYREDILNTTKSIVQTYNNLPAESFGFDDLMEIFKLDLIDPSKRDEVKAEIAAEYKAYTDAVAKAQKDATYTYRKATTVAGRTTYNTSKGFKQAQFDEDLRKLNEQYKNAILTQSLLEAATDDQLQDIATRLQEYSSVGKQISTMDLTYNRMKTRLESQIEKDEKGDRGKKTEIIPTGSITELEKKIQEARKSFMNATTDDARAAADALVKDLEAKKAILEIQFKYTGLEDVGLGDKLANADPLAPLKNIGNVDMSGVVYAPDVKVFDSWGDRINHVANKNRDLIDTVYGVSDAVAGMGNILGENGGQWAQWGANVLSAIGQGLPAIMALTEAKKAEATANTASAASGAASSVAGIPIAGPIMAVAAVASVLGALANLPKFAYGGIVGGSSFSGDNMLARVNSGEMILNSAQQNRLFQIANGGGSSGGTKKIELVLSGKTARAVIDADNKWWDRI